MSTFSLYRKLNNNPVTRYVRGRWIAWLKRRLPPQRQVVLDQRRIFIFPTWMGLAYIATALLLFLAGVNYDNNLLLNFSFFMGSLFVVTILQTFANLSALTVTAGNTEPAFAGSEAQFNIRFSKSKQKEHHSIQCLWEGYECAPQNLLTDTACSVEMLLATKVRGRYQPGRMRIQSVYPLGLCRAWTWVDLNMSCIVYPKPVACEVSAQSAARHADGAAGSSDGNEDFDGLRAYRHSDSLKIVDWKSFARRGTMLSKEFHGYQSQSIWVDWDQMSAVNVELKLSRMCFLVMEYGKTNLEYGLILPGTHIAPDRGKAHQAACLEALARY
ncbi:DUF58 domain-containing protein [Ketobacter sp. MCCC 1A13808]|uniref:DUF58 domain-containing protein n=1 Tax=Ketobacter sp. MCCC 1A13808 TaxID=2602738 RepID=UPI0012EC5537|nr:DUF58 domain-containing protein [Ketobacter sp. MCCC 1A13808]MVF12454.1 DUF58 domain-containing protein [Ketobacter sp. MCCC 1A13808]